MKVEVISEYGLDEALLGLGLSYGKTSELKKLTPAFRADMLDIAKKLASKGLAHNKFLRQIAVYLDVTAPFYFHKQLVTYKIGVTTQSESTMHTIMRKPFSSLQFEIDNFDSFDTMTINNLNSLRDKYLSSNNKEEKQQIWNKVIQTLPCSYLQRRIISANYEVLRAIFKQRAKHKLGLWKIFIDSVYRQINYPEFLWDVYNA